VCDRVECARWLSARMWINEVLSCVCAGVCVCMYVYTFLYVCLWVHTHVYVHACMHCVLFAMVVVHVSAWRLCVTCNGVICNMYVYITML
jgi:hypothetical protein